MLRHQEPGVWSDLSANEAVPAVAENMLHMLLHDCIKLSVDMCPQFELQKKFYPPPSSLAEFDQQPPGPINSILLKVETLVLRISVGP